MNRIQYLETAIEERKHLIQDRQDRQISFAQELACSSMEGFIEELQEQLRIEKEKREKEVIEIRLQGHGVNQGDLPLKLLGDISKHLAASWHAASSRIATGKEPWGRIAERITGQVNLRFAGLAPGSTRLFITGDTAPDLFGRSLLEDSLSKTFKLLNAQEPEILTDIVDDLGFRYTKHLTKFLDLLSKWEIEPQMSWRDPSEQEHRWEADISRIQYLTSNLENVGNPEVESIEIYGQIEMIDSRGKLAVIDDVNQLRYLGKFTHNLMKIITKLHIKDHVRINLDKHTRRNLITNKKLIAYHIKEIFHKEDSTV